MADFLKHLSNTHLIIILEILFVMIIILVITIIIALRVNKNKTDKITKLNAQNNKLENKIQSLESNRESLNRKNNYHSSYLNSVFMTMNEGIIVFDNNYNVKLANPRAMEMLNLDSMIFFDYSMSEYRNKINAIIPLLDNKENEEIVINDGQRYLQHRFTKIADRYTKDMKLGYLVTITDVSETELNNKLRNEFIENISHEFKTPMTIIQGYVETLSLWSDLDDKIRTRSLEVVQQELVRLNGLVDQLLSLTKIDAKLELKMVDIKIVDKMQLLIEQYNLYLPEKNIDFKLVVDNKDLIIKSHELTVVNAISNILENAKKYTKYEDTVSIEVTNDNEFCCIKISDNGKGIESKHLDRIFDRFYRIEHDRNSKTGGTGLGLPIAKDSLERIGGTIFVESEVSKGTTFIIKIPINNKYNNKHNEGTK